MQKRHVDIIIQKWYYISRDRTEFGLIILVTTLNRGMLIYSILSQNLPSFSDPSPAVILSAPQTSPTSSSSSSSAPHHSELLWWWTRAAGRGSVSWRHSVRCDLTGSVQRVHDAHTHSRSVDLLRKMLPVSNYVLLMCAPITTLILPLTVMQIH